MDFAIDKIVLWPSLPSFPPRVVEFKHGAVNVITGQSRSGKSALIAIVDFCLGSDKCMIPVGLIRDTVAWFGLMLSIDGKKVLVARRNPGRQESTGDMFLSEETDGHIPESVSKNFNVEEVKEYLNRRSGLPNIELPGAESQPYRERPSFRDMAAFMFQPQYIVANPNTLFYKADTTEHREKLKGVLPFVLGAVTAEQMATSRRLRDLESSLTRLRHEFALRQEAVRRSQQEIQPLFYRARELGLIPLSVTPGTAWSTHEYMDQLRIAVQRAEFASPSGLESGSTESAVHELLKLRATEERIAANIARQRAHLARMERLASVAAEYGSELGMHSSRFENLGWFEDQIAGVRGCPVCGSETESAHQTVAEIKELARQVSHDSARLRSAPQVLDEEILDVRAALRDMERELGGVRKQISILEDESELIAKARQTLAEVHRFAGYAGQVIAAHQAVSAEGKEPAEIGTLQSEVDSLRAATSPVAQRRRLEAALDSLATKMSHYAGILNLSRMADYTTISSKELTIIVQNSSGRYDFLWELGSGANWVGYHLAAMFSLHEYLIEQPNSPVPQFLMIDQPSQVYFPETLAGESGDAPPQSVDVQEVHRIFEAMTEAVRRTQGRLQVIVTDHAGAFAWQGLQAHVVEEWRPGKGDFLIPDAWIRTDQYES